MINTKDFEIFRQNMASLKELSADGSDPNHIQYMTDSTIDAIRFDDVKTQYTNKLKLSEETASSVDAVAETEDGLLFIPASSVPMGHFTHRALYPWGT